MAMVMSMKLLGVLLTMVLVASMAGRGEAQPDDPCLDDDCDVDRNCQVGYECMEIDVNACGPGMGYCWNFCDYPCRTTEGCKEGWECIGPGTCTAGMGYCWRTHVTVADPCDDPFFHCSADSDCGGEGFKCYGVEINRCGAGLGYCDSAA